MTKQPRFIPKNKDERQKYVGNNDGLTSRCSWGIMRPYTVVPLLKHPNDYESWNPRATIMCILSDDGQKGKK